MSDGIVFGLALASYAGLAWDLLRRYRGIAKRPVTIAVASLVLLHVLGVWWTRFEFDLERALAKGPFSFALFHAAAGLIAAAPCLREPWARRALLVSFALVTAPVLAVPWRYPELWWTGCFSIPTALVAAIAGVHAGRARARRRA